MKTTGRTLLAAGFEVADQIYSPGSTVPWHTHGMAEFCFVVRGSMKETARNSSIPYARHDVGFKPAGLAHRVEVPADGARCLVLAIPPTTMRTVEERVSRLGEPAMFSGGILADLCARAFRELQAVDETTPLVLEGIGFEMLASAGRLSTPKATTEAPEWLRRVCERLCDDPARRPSLTELAQIGGLQPTQLTQAFRQCYRCSIGEYLRRVRMARARTLLGERKRSLAQIAGECGFYDQSHFTRVFRRYAGETPGQFRHRSGDGGEVNDPTVPLEPLACREGCRI